MCQEMWPHSLPLEALWFKTVAMVKLPLTNMFLDCVEQGASDYVERLELAVISTNCYLFR